LSAAAGLITWSLERASELHGDPTNAIYERLFQQQPEFEALFVLDRTGVIRGSMLAHIFDALMDMEGPRAYGLQFFQAERVNHEGALSVTAADYAHFLAIVRDTIRDLLGGEWTPAVDAAWRNALDQIAATAQRLEVGTPLP
jgi:hemoglobin-like flavoprotein